MEDGEKCLCIVLGMTIRSRVNGNNAVVVVVVVVVVAWL